MSKTITEEAEEIETEKDNTSLISPIIEYHEKLLAAVLTYEDDPIEISKILVRLKADALNLTGFSARIEIQMANLMAVKTKRDDIKKFSAECLAFLKPKTPEVKAT